MLGTLYRSSGGRYISPRAAAYSVYHFVSGSLKGNFVAYLNSNIHLVTHVNILRIQGSIGYCQLWANVNLVLLIFEYAGIALLFIVYPDYTREFYSQCVYVLKHTNMLICVNNLIQDLIRSSAVVHLDTVTVKY